MEIPSLLILGRKALRFHHRKIFTNALNPIEEIVFYSQFGEGFYNECMQNFFQMLILHLLEDYMLFLLQNSTSMVNDTFWNFKY